MTFDPPCEFGSCRGQATRAVTYREGATVLSTRKACVTHEIIARTIARGWPGRVEVAPL